ncbi:hypothetical protein XENORESO_012120 [Xenotaenia resolanae]|uniref:Uncharacterized protein n=1 Tax=Xenotaenia resolanae TaxID=208358 RepID=A0ABV0VQE7_9TELE
MSPSCRDIRGRIDSVNQSISLLIQSVDSRSRVGTVGIKLVCDWQGKLNKSVINNISYAEAAKRVKKPKDVPGKVQLSPTPGQRQIRSDTVLTVEKIMLFTAYVINCTDQVKHKAKTI